MLTQIGRLFAISRPVTDCLVTHVLPILEQKVPDGALSTHEPVWKDFIHFLPSLASASGEFDANGPYVRTVVGAGNNGLSTGTLGSLPLLGQLVGSSPGGSPIAGVAPKWVGTLTASAFRPDVECSSDPVPDLAASRTAAPDFRPDHAAAAFHPTSAQLRRALSLLGGEPLGSRR
jgi:hypothetical protein